MSLLQAKQLVWDEIIEEVRNHWEYITLMDEQGILIKDYEGFILTSKEEGENKSHICKRFIKFLNERLLSELRPIHVVDRVIAIMDISKVVQKEECRVKSKKYLEVVSKNVVAFNMEFDRIVRASFPNCWNFWGVLIEWEKYIQILVEAKRKVDFSHEKTSTLKGKTVVNYLKRNFRLLGMVNILFIPRLNYTGLTNFKISYQLFF